MADALFARSREAITRDRTTTGAQRREALTRLVDAWVTERFDDATADVPGLFALLAVGGYGRSELTGASDLDVVLVHRAGTSAAARAADALWYPMWDAGLRLDHSVRTVDQARRVADQDLRVALGLLDARCVAGDETLAQEVISGVLTDWRSGAHRRLAALRDLVADRRDRFGDLSQLLEPDLKESYGGLREAVVLRAIAASWTADIPHDGWPAAVHDLLDVREALHRCSGGTGDRLAIQEQAAVAIDLDHADADELLRKVHECARAIAYASDVAWHRVTRSSPRPRLLGRPLRRSVHRRPLADGVIEQDGEVVLARGASPATDDGLLVRAAAAAAQHDLLLAPHTLERLAAEVARPMTWSSESRDRFVSLLGSGPGLVPVWFALDRAGVMGDLVPGWGSIRGLPQHGGIHRFTVDRHLVETAVQARELARTVDRPDLLLVAALLHDIGKGSEGDHCVVGAPIAEGIANRMGFASVDSELVGRLVRAHLLLPDIATRRDIEEPATIAAVAEAVGDVAFLDLLYALTIADARATGPAATSSWRLGLVDDLVGRTRAYLSGIAAPSPPPLSERHAQVARCPGVQIRLYRDTQTARVVVAAPDEPRLLAVVAGALSLRRLDVLAARTTTVDGRSIQEWTVRPRFGELPDEAILLTELRRAIAGTVDVARQLAMRDADHPRDLRSRYPAPVVTVAIGTRPTTGVVEVRAHDAPGLVFDIVSALAAAGVVVAGAKVTTLGSDVVDVFFVHTRDAHALTADRRNHLRAMVLSGLGGAGK